MIAEASKKTTYIVRLPHTLPIDNCDDVPRVSLTSAPTARDAIQNHLFKYTDESRAKDLFEILSANPEFYTTVAPDVHMEAKDRGRITHNDMDNARFYALALELASQDGYFDGSHGNAPESMKPYVFLARTLLSKARRTETEFNRRSVA